MFGKLGTS